MLYRDASICANSFRNTPSISTEGSIGFLSNCTHDFHFPVVGNLAVSRNSRYETFVAKTLTEGFSSSSQAASRTRVDDGIAETMGVSVAHASARERSRISLGSGYR